MSKKIFTENISDEMLAGLIDKTLNFERNNKNASFRNMKNIWKAAAAVAAVVLVIGLVNSAPLLQFDSGVTPGGEVTVTVMEENIYITDEVRYVVEDLSGLFYRNVEIELKQKQIASERIFLADETVPEGYIIYTEPGTGEIMRGDEIIRIYVSSGYNNTAEESEFYTYEEYLAYIEELKAFWRSLIDCIDENWTPISGEPVLTQEIYDKDWANAEPYMQQTLEDIKNGAKVQKLPGHSYPFAVYETLSPNLDLKCRIENGKWVLYKEDSATTEIFDTKDDMLERARWWLSRGTKAGEVDMAQANAVYRGLYNTGETADPEPIPAFMDFWGTAGNFIKYHHVYYNYDFLDYRDELPFQFEKNTLYAIWQTYLLETVLGETFEIADYYYLIPREAVERTVSYIYNDGDFANYDRFYLYPDNPEYFWLPDGFSPDTKFFDILSDTLVIDDKLVYKFDVVFYDDPNEEFRQEAGTFSYEFERVLYKDKIVYYRFIGASRVK